MYTVFSQLFTHQKAQVAVYFMFCTEMLRVVVRENRAKFKNVNRRVSTE